MGRYTKHFLRRAQVCPHNVSDKLSEPLMQIAQATFCKVRQHRRSSLFETRAWLGRSQPAVGFLKLRGRIGGDLMPRGG
jgi:hypothetical protein